MQKHQNRRRARIAGLHFLDRPGKEKAAAQELLRYWPECDL